VKTVEKYGNNFHAGCRRIRDGEYLAQRGKIANEWRKFRLMMSFIICTSCQILR
jgi:hypothetical protein